MPSQRSLPTRATAGSGRDIQKPFRYLSHAETAEAVLAPV